MTQLTSEENQTTADKDEKHDEDPGLPASGGQLMIKMINRV